MPGVQPNHCLGILRKNIRHRPIEQQNEEHPTAFFEEKNLNFHRNINNNNREFFDENENSEKKQYSGMLKSKISNNRRINDDSELINKSFANACVQTNNLNLIDENRNEKNYEFEENNEFISGRRNKYRKYGRNQEEDLRKNIENDDNLDFPTREQENNSKNQRNYTKYLNYLQEKEKFVVKNVLKEKDNINFFMENQKKLEKSEIDLTPTKPQTYYYKNKNYDHECLPRKTLPVEKIEENMEIRKNEYSRYLREEPEKNTEFDDLIENEKINKSSFLKKSEIKKSENERKRPFKSSLEEDISRILRAEEFNEEFNEKKGEIQEINEKNDAKNSKTEQTYHKMFNEVVNDRFSEQGK